jgi:hypothetical protein
MKPVKILATLAIAGGIAAGALGTAGVANADQCWDGCGHGGHGRGWDHGGGGDWGRGGDWGGGWGGDQGGWNGGWEPWGGVCLFGACI